MTNAASNFWRDGRQFPSDRQFDDAISDYERHEQRLGDDPNAIADAMGITRGSGCVIRRMARERREI
jgi:hypothetical protein